MSGGGRKLWATLASNAPLLTSRKKSLAHIIKGTFRSDHKHWYLISC